jgi:upstream activation factor subunit UAF30
METELAALRAEIKALTKIVRKIRSTQEDPTGEKAKTRAANNGFNRTLEISPNLRTFLKLSDEEAVSRSEVTRRINQYITSAGLKHPDNGRMIILDDALRDLLQPPEGVQVTFLNIQKYLSPHYVKAPKEPKAPKAPKEPKAAAPVKEAEPVAAAATTTEEPKKRVVVKKTKTVVA